MDDKNSIGGKGMETETAAQRAAVAQRWKLQQRQGENRVRSSGGDVT